MLSDVLPDNYIFYKNVVINDILYTNRIKKMANREFQLFLFGTTTTVPAGMQLPLAIQYKESPNFYAHLQIRKMKDKRIKFFMEDCI